MTCAEISARALKRLDDDATTSATIAPDAAGGVPTEMLWAINEGQELFCLLSLCLETTAVFTFASLGTFASLRGEYPDLIVPLRLSIGSARLKPATIAELDAENDAWQLTAGTPARYVAMGFSFFACTPQPLIETAGSIIYARSPVQMVADDFPEIPELYHDCLTDYAIYRIRLKEGAQGLERGMVHLNRFLDDCQACGDFVRAKSRAARYDALPFELALADRSKLLGLPKVTKK